MGNPILGDDAVGLVVAERLMRALEGTDNIEVRQACAGGLDLVEMLSGFGRAFIVDAFAGGGRPGDIYQLEPETLPLPQRLGAMHEIGLAAALRLGQRLGLPMPRQIAIYAVEICQGYDFGERLSPAVEEAADKLVHLLLDELNRREPDADSASHSRE